MALLFSYQGRRTEHYGSDRVKEKFRTLLETDQSWRDAFVEDMRDLSEADPENDDNSTGAEAYCRSRRNRPVQRLPQKLKYMKFEECEKYLTEAILRSQNIQGHDGDKIIYQDASLMPRFWKNSVWEWLLHTKCLHNMKCPPGGPKKLERMRELIQLYLDYEGLDSAFSLVRTGANFSWRFMARYLRRLV